jgi:hypothetical protein
LSYGSWAGPGGGGVHEVKDMFHSDPRPAYAVALESNAVPRVVEAFPVPDGKRGRLILERRVFPRTVDLLVDARRGIHAMIGQEKRRSGDREVPALARAGAFGSPPREGGESSSRRSASTGAKRAP